MIWWSTVIGSHIIRNVPVKTRSEAVSCKNESVFLCYYLEDTRTKGVAANTCSACFIVKIRNKSQFMTVSDRQPQHQYIILYAWKTTTTPMYAFCAHVLFGRREQSNEMTWFKWKISLDFKIPGNIWDIVISQLNKYIT